MSRIETAYLVEFRVPDAPDRIGLLIAVGVSAQETEHVARATITTIQPLCREREVLADLTAFIPGEEPDWLQEMELSPFYRRTLGQRLVTSVDTLQ